MLEVTIGTLTVAGLIFMVGLWAATSRPKGRDGKPPASASYHSDAGTHQINKVPFRTEATAYESPSRARRTS